MNSRPGTPGSIQTSFSASLFIDRLSELKTVLLNISPHNSTFNVDALLDAFIAIFDDCSAYQKVEKNSNLQQFTLKYETLIQRIRQLRINKNDFTFVKKLAKGQFGEVSLVRGKLDQKIYAMKTLRKMDMMKQADIAFFMEERQILATPNVKWITSLYAAFQDELNLYLVMDYVPGGDLASILLRADDGELTIDESFTRFYVAETVLALEELHNLNFVHRDLKPGNVLIDMKGHVKLADFGSCIMLEKDKVTSQTVVGTPDYISPEVLQANSGKGAYGKECDFWSLGITMYEMLVGDPPFYSDSLAETYHQIMTHKEHLKIPEDIGLSANAIDFLKHLICDKEERLKDYTKIKQHPFFEKINWEIISEEKAPFVPTLKSDDDSSNFLNLDDDCTSETTTTRNFYAGRDRTFNPHHLSFIGFTFSKHANLSESLLRSDVRNRIRTISSPVDAPERMRQPSIINKLNSHADQVNLLEEQLRLLKEKSSADSCQIEAKEKHISLLEANQALQNGEIKQLKSEISFQRDSCKKLNSEISNLQGQLRTLQEELSNNSTEKQSLLGEITSLNHQLFESRQKLQAQQSQMVSLESELGAATSRVLLLENEIGSLSKQGNIRDSLEKDVVCLQSEKNLFQRKLSDLQKQTSIAENETSQLKRQIQELELQVFRLETKSRSDSDQLAQFSAAEKNIKEKLAEKEKSVRDLQSELGSIGREFHETTMKFENEKQLLSAEKIKTRSLNNLVTSLKKELETFNLEKGQLLTTQKEINDRLELALNTMVDMSAYNTVSENLEQANSRIGELTSRLEEIQLRNTSLTEENDRLRNASGETFFGLGSMVKRVALLSSPTSINTADDNVSETSKRHRIVVTKLKALEQKLNQEISKRSALEIELNTVRLSKQMLEQEFEEYKSQQQRDRQHSSASSFLGRTGTLLSRIKGHGTLDRGILSGWLKLRVIKGNNRKIEWHKKYVVISDFCLYLYDKEKEADSHTSKPLIDFRDDLVVIRAAKPKEFIHMSAKEISCILCIQVVSAGFTSGDSMNTKNDRLETRDSLQQKLQTIVKNIEKEEKLKDATTKILVISKGDAKKHTQEELDECLRRLRSLKAEKENLEQQLAQSSDILPSVTLDTASSLLSEELSPSSSHFNQDEIFSEIEKKVSYRKGVENMLSLVHNENARSELQKQLSSVNRDIQALKTSIENLSESCDADNSVITPKRLAQRNQVYEQHGHQFRLRDQISSTTCYHCQDSVFGNHQTLECPECHLVCHKFCYTSIAITCHEYTSLKKHGITWFFMANDEVDRKRWISFIDQSLRKAKDKDRQSLTPLNSSKFPHSEGDIAALRSP